MANEVSEQKNTLRSKLPLSLGRSGLLVGYSLENDHPKVPFGFRFKDEAHFPESGRLDPYLFVGEGHLLTIAPTGAGKGVSCIIPAILRHTGDIIVMDPKGENYAVTASFRKSLGQKVVLLDPYGSITRQLSHIEPDHRSVSLFGVLPYLSDSQTAAAESLASMLIDTDQKTSDPFWNFAAANILSGLIDYYANDFPTGSLDRLVVELTDFPATTENSCSLETDIKHEATFSKELTMICQENQISPDALLTAYLRVRRYHQTLFDPDKDEQNASDERLAEMKVDFQSEIALFSSGVWTLERFRQLSSCCEKIIFQAQNFRQNTNRLQERISLHQSEGHRFPYPRAILRMMNSERPLCRRVSEMILSTPDRTWGSMLTTLQNQLAYLNAEKVRACLSESDFNWREIESGTGTTVYIVIPPHRLRSASRLPATLFKSIVNVLSSRSRIPAEKTLLLLDEVAQLGHMEELITAKTLLRGYGVQVWSFWQDLSQLKAIYPTVWPTLVNNCKVIQAFGCATPLMAAGLNELMDVPTKDIIDLEPEEMLLSIYGDEIVTALRPIYYLDPAFEGRFAENFLNNVIDVEGSSDEDRKATLVQEEVDSDVSSMTDAGVPAEDIRHDRNFIIEVKRAKRFFTGAGRLIPKKRKE